MIIYHASWHTLDSIGDDGGPRVLSRQIEFQPQDFISYLAVVATSCQWQLRVARSLVFTETTRWGIIHGSRILGY